MWSPLLPASRRGSEWSGLAHIADWFYTYAVGVAGVSVEEARGAGPYPDDATNLWSALTVRMLKMLSLSLSLFSFATLAFSLAFQSKKEFIFISWVGWQVNVRTLCV